LSSPPRSTPTRPASATSVTAAERELTAAGVSEKPGVVVADAGYRHDDQMDDLAAHGITILARRMPASI
jgi:hypothetical protein